MLNGYMSKMQIIVLKKESFPLSSMFAHLRQKYLLMLSMCQVLPISYLG